MERLLSEMTRTNYVGTYDRPSQDGDAGCAARLTVCPPSTPR